VVGSCKCAVCVVVELWGVDKLLGGVEDKIPVVSFSCLVRLEIDLMYS
jgi:hypothetical protein